MIAQIFSWALVVLLFAASLAILLTRDWRRSLAFLAIQYLGVFLLTQTHWTLSMAAVKLVTGWMVATILGITRTALDPELATSPDRSLPESRLFRILAAILLLLVVFSATTSLVDLLPGIGVPEVAGSLILMAMGLLHLGLTIQPLRVVIGLLTVLAGFEIIYAVVETSTLVAALLSVINLGLALVGAYLLTAGSDDLEAI
ncbi:MAG: hypothetical protein HN855_14170 [Anaerolineae bacterium]|jgi:hypothetical protein|nr:hypothetical protein [Anaerolineae bacterium]MBT7072868.1 hypothetical protein [Anaerolineae bacterium]MBT7326301.1 hypothetical protein [Anaerolineae bacterium]